MLDRATPSEKRSWMTATDARVRLGAFIVLGLALAFLESLTACLAALALSFALLVAAKPGFRYAVSRFLAVNVFIVFLWCVLPWSTKGQGYAALAFVTHEGVALALRVTLKANAAFCLVLACIGTMRVSELAWSMRAFGCPGKLVTLLIFTERAIGILEENWEALLTAAKLRGFAPKTDRHTYRTFAGFIASMVVTGARASQAASEALRLKGFTGELALLAPARKAALPGGMLAAYAAASLLVIGLFECGLWTRLA